MKLTLALAFAAIAYAQETKPAPLTLTEKVAIGKILEQEFQLQKQYEAIGKQLQEIGQVKQALATALYAARPTAKPEEWVPKNDLSDWVPAVKTATPAAPVESKP